MADTSAPSLAVPRDSQPYAPVSWAAVGAICSAIVFVLLLLFYGLQSVLKNQPLLYDMFIGLPILTLVLAFVAWMHVRNSEGTRTGMRLAVIAFWVGLVGILAYGSYLFAISLAVRTDAEKQFVDWVKNLGDLDPGNPADPNLYRAFHKTINAGLRKSVSPADVPAMDRRFSSEMAGFRQTDLLGICFRNRGQCKFTPQGLVQWTQTPKTPQDDAKIDCVLACSLECPEGVYELNVPMLARTDEAGLREWQILPFSTGLVKSARLTDYGRRVYELKSDANQAASRFLFYVQNPAFQDRAYYFFAKKPFNVSVEDTYLKAGRLPPAGTTAVVGGTAILEKEVLGYETDLVTRWFTPTLGADAPKAPEDRKKKEEEMRKQFGSIWNSGRIRVSGVLVKDNPEKDSVLLVGNDRIELHHPIELALPGGESSANTARGRLILVCDNPDVLAQVNRERQSANPADATDVTTPRPNWTPLFSAWKIVRIESDLVPMPQAPAGRPDGMPPGMPGMPGIGE